MFLKTITIGPFSAFFTNVNTEMKLPGHSHFAEVTLEYETTGSRGFPAFEGTYKAIQDEIKSFTSAPFRNATNEYVAEALFELFDVFDHPEIRKWGGMYHLRRLTLAVRGVPDKIGHADGFTSYTVWRQK